VEKVTKLLLKISDGETKHPEALALTSQLCKKKRFITQGFEQHRI
jgi:hypothetical protein